MTPVLRLENLYKSYGALRVTDGVSLEVYPRRMSCVDWAKWRWENHLDPSNFGQSEIRQWAAFV